MKRASRSPRHLATTGGSRHCQLKPCGAAGEKMGDWIAFWDSEHSIYVNARHRDVHYRTVAQDIRAHVPPGAAVLDYGCGEALHADLVAASAQSLILCEAAPTGR